MDGWAFTPDKISINAEGKLKHTEAIWEVEVDPLTPPSFNALKPKLWLLKKLELEQGKFYVTK